MTTNIFPFLCGIVGPLAMTGWLLMH